MPRGSRAVGPYPAADEHGAQADDSSGRDPADYVAGRDGPVRASTGKLRRQPDWQL